MHTCRALGYNDLHVTKSPKVFWQNILLCVNMILIGHLPCLSWVQMLWYNYSSVSLNVSSDRPTHDIHSTSPNMGQIANAMYIFLFQYKYQKPLTPHPKHIGTLRKHEWICHWQVLNKKFDSFSHSFINWLLRLRKNILLNIQAVFIFMSANIGLANLFGKSKFAQTSHDCNRKKLELSSLID